MAACPTLFVAAPASGQGKTTVVAALARLHARQGRRVRVFKCGPDFLDPQIHAIASGSPCYNVDLWMCGEADAAWRLFSSGGRRRPDSGRGRDGAARWPTGALRSHSFNHSQTETLLALLARAIRPDGRQGEAVYRRKRLTASYMHMYFPSNPGAAARLFLAQ